jgi:hypothetical protein
MAVVGQAMQGGKSWAKARLVRGQSAGGVWEIDQQYPQARLGIGSDPGAGWSIQAPGVRPMHFEMYWDGKCLFVADTQRVGGVTLNGKPVGAEWAQVRGRGEVAFGQAALAIETSDSSSASAPDPVSAHRISASEGPSASHNLGDLTGEATRMTDSPSWTPMEGEATRIQDSELDAAPPPPKLGAPPPPPPKMGGPPAAPQRPRLGGSNDGPGAAPQKTLTQDELGPALGEATRMVSMPEPGAPGGPPPSIVLAPGLGQPGPPSMGGPMMGGPQQGFAAPSAPTGPGGFAAPPGFGEAPPPAKPVGAGAKLPFGLTPRTAAMVGVLVLAILVLALIGLGDSDEEEIVDAPPATDVPVAPPTAVAPTTLAVAPPTAIPGYPPATVPGYPPTTAIPGYPPPTAYAPPATFAPATALAPPASGVPVGPTPERLAADQVLAGRYNEALPLYQALALQHPERPEFSMMVHILEQRIRAAQCVNGIGPDGRPCVRQ